MALGFFESSSDPSQPDSYEAIQRKRKLVEAMLAQGMDSSPVQSWTQGLARLANAGVGAWKESKLDKQEKDSSSLGTQKILDALTGGGSSSSAPAPAPMGVNYASDGQPAPAMKTADPVSANLEPWQKGVLNAIAAPESNGQYDIRYTPKGGAKFAGFDQHPGIFEPGPAGPSSAAGRYQFTKTTWDKMGGGNFSPENQDQRALQLASQDYQRRTGRDLGADIQKNGFTPEIAKALAPTWAGLGDNPNKAISAYAATVGRSANAADLPSPGAREVGGAPFTPPSPYGDLSGTTALSPYGDLSGARNALQPQPQPQQAPQAAPNPDVPAQAAGNVSSTPGQPDMIAQATAARAANPQPGDQLLQLGPNGQLPPGAEKLLGALEGSPEARAMASATSPQGQGAPVDKSKMLLMMAMDPRFSPQQRQMAMHVATTLQKEDVRPTWGKVGTDDNGHDILGWINSKTMQVTPGSMNNNGTAKAPTVQRVKQADGSEVAVQWDDKQKTWVPLKAPDGGNPLVSPKMTEAQAKDVNLYNRGSKIIDRLEKQDGELTKSWSALGAQVPGAGNYLKSDSYRQAEQTGRELLAIILRKDTGAAVTDTEMEQYGQMYLPRPGDDPGTIKQKQEGRRSAIEGMKMGLGPGEIFFRQGDALEKAKAAAAAPAAPEAPKRRKFNPATGAIE